MDSCTLPNRSTDSTSPSASPSSILLVGGASQTSSAGSTGMPASARAVPVARCAATGMKMSLPWKVRETGWFHSASLVSSTAARAPPSAVIAQESRPLSGPTRMPAPAWTATARRLVPTPGSTTATCTAGGIEGTVCASTAAPHVAGRDEVSDVDDPGTGGDPRGDAVARGDEAVLEAEVGQEGQAAHRGHKR